MPPELAAGHAVGAGLGVSRVTIVPQNAGVLLASVPGMV